MGVTEANVLSIASVAIALVSVLYARRSSRIARESLTLAHRTGQATYEATKAAHSPAVSLFLTEVVYRPATPRELDGIVGAEARAWATKHEADSLEVVIQGRLVNNLRHEVLLTCRDHPRSGRTVWYTYRNESVFIIDDVETELGRTILSPEQEATFVWIDRRPKQDWIDIYNLDTKNMWGDPELELPRLSPSEAVYGVWRYRSLHLARRAKVKRSGFQIICETRTVERVANVWLAEVVKTPIESGGRNENGHIVFGEHFETLTGPVDDSVVYYRVDSDATLAQLRPPKWLHVPGRF